MTYSERMGLWRAVWAAEKQRETTHVHLPIDTLAALGERRIKARTERFFVISLDSAHKIIRVRTSTKGLINRVLVHARETFRGAILDNAAGVILAHNHPSGNMEPSSEDDAITKRLVDAGQLLGIPVLDHVIVGRTGYFSYIEENRL